MSVHGVQTTQLPKTIAQHPLTVARSAKQNQTRTAKHAESDLLQMHEASRIMERQLKPGSPAHDVAMTVIRQFETAVKEGDLSRTKVAKREARKLLPIGGIYTTAILHKGLGIAGHALYQAGNLLFTQRG
jgi:hypothetical protein